MSSELNRATQPSELPGIGEKAGPLISIRNLTVHFDLGRERAPGARDTDKTGKKKQLATKFLRLVVLGIVLTVPTLMVIVVSRED